jgi:AraC-like DNA-binding protein
MLKQPNSGSIAEIALACGFNDSNYFSVKFRKHYGISPKKLQQKYPCFARDAQMEYANLF